MDDWEISGTTLHRSLAAAQGTAIWLGSMERLSGWEFIARTMEDGSHRVLKRRVEGRVKPDEADRDGSGVWRSPAPASDRDAPAREPRTTLIAGAR